MCLTCKNRCYYFPRIANGLIIPETQKGLINVYVKYIPSDLVIKLSTKNVIYGGFYLNNIKYNLYVQSKRFYFLAESKFHMHYEIIKRKFPFFEQNIFCKIIQKNMLQTKCPHEKIGFFGI